MRLSVITTLDSPKGEYRGIEMADGRAFTTADPVADFSHVLQALVADGMTVAMHPEDLGLVERTAGAPARSDALTDRVNAWLSIAMTRVVIKPLEGTDTFTATLPPFRKFAVVERSESQALAEMRLRLEQWARSELLAGRDLPTWESQIPEITPAMKCLVRMTNLRHELKCRAAEWGGERMNLPAGAVERCLVEIDQLVTRHAMQINGVPPPPPQP